MNIVPLLVSCIFIAFDILTGWLKAIATGTTNSSIMRVGLMRKLGELVSVLFGYVCQYALPLIGISVSIPFAGALSTYIVLMETASVIENICAINPNLREGLSKIFSDEKLLNNTQKGAHEKENSNEN